MEFISNLRTTHLSYSRTFPNNFSRLGSRSDYAIPDERNIFRDYSEINRRPASITEETIKFAGMKIFASVMLSAWRRRREEVKQLVEKIEELKEGTLRARNQVHVYNTLFRVEQKRNDELTVQLKRSMESISQAKYSYESLTTCVIGLKADKAILEQNMRTKNKEVDLLRNVYKRTKSDLIRSVIQERALHIALAKERRSKYFLENQKNKLIDEICCVTVENCNLKDTIRKVKISKEEELQLANNKIKSLEAQMEKYQEENAQVQEYIAANTRMIAELNDSKEEICSLKKTIEDSISTKLRMCWDSLVYHQKSAIKMAHLVAFYLLPATPPPKYKFISN